MLFITLNVANEATGNLPGLQIDAFGKQPSKNASDLCRKVRYYNNAIAGGGTMLIGYFIALSLLFQLAAIYLALG